MTRFAVALLAIAFAGNHALADGPAFPGSGVRGGGQSSDFGRRLHMDELADRLQVQANDVLWEMYHNYRLNPHFRETYREMYQVLKDAQHIHHLVHEDAYHRHHHGNDDHIARDLHEMDSLFHHIEDDVAHWRPDFYRHGGHGHSAHHGGNLHFKLERFETTLHHLMEDYGVLSRFGGGDIAPPPGATSNGYGYGYRPGNRSADNSRYGISIPLSKSIRLQLGGRIGR